MPSVSNWFFRSRRNPSSSPDSGRSTGPWPRTIYGRLICSKAREAMPNPHGTAPGQFLSTDHGALALLPGPPRELKPMVENELVPRLRPVLPRAVIKVRSFRITGIGESDLDTLIAPVYTKYTNPVTTVLSSPGDLFVTLRARAETDKEADDLLREAGNPIADLLGDRIYSNLPDEPLEAVIGCLLRKRHAKVSTAESCTGGLLAARLTEQGGSSDFFIGGYVTYSDAQKHDQLGIREGASRETYRSERAGRSGHGGRRPKQERIYLRIIDNWLRRPGRRHGLRSGGHGVFGHFRSRPALACCACGMALTVTASAHSLRKRLSICCGRRCSINDAAVSFTSRFARPHRLRETRRPSLRSL